MKVSLLALVCFTCIIWRTDQQQCHPRELSLCFLPSLIISRKSLVPNDENALNKTCRLWMDEQKCLAKYEAKCLDDFLQLAIQLLMGKEHRLQKDLCGENEQMRKDFLKAAPCLSETFQLTLDTCLDNLENILYIVTGEDIELAHNAGCCYYEGFYRCFYQHFNEKCDQQHLPVVEEVFRMSLFGTIHNICISSDPESDECIELLSRNVTNPSERSSYLTRMALLYLRH